MAQPESERTGALGVVGRLQLTTGPVYVVGEGQQALVVRLGAPGLAFKLPLIANRERRPHRRRLGSQRARRRGRRARCDVEPEPEDRHPAPT